MGLKKILVGLVGVAALIGVSGCSSSGSVAATVDGTVITENTIQSSVKLMNTALAPYTLDDTYDPVGFALTGSIMEMVLTDSLGQLGVTVTDQIRDQVVANSYAPNSIVSLLWADPGARSTVTGFVDLTVANTLIQMGNLDYDTLVTLVKAVPVSVNPRYGDWDAEKLIITSRLANTVSGSLADPFPS